MVRSNGAQDTQLLLYAIFGLRVHQLALIDNLSADGLVLLRFTKTARAVQAEHFVSLARYSTL